MARAPHDDRRADRGDAGVGGDSLLGIQRWGRDIEFDGPLLMVSFLAPGLAEAVEQEARRRRIPVEVVEPEI
jgi:hypothetical protein